MQWCMYKLGLQTQLNTHVFCLTQEIGTDFPHWGVSTLISWSRRMNIRWKLSLQSGLKIKKKVPNFDYFVLWKKCKFRVLCSTLDPLVLKKKKSFIEFYMIFDIVSHYARHSSEIRGLCLMKWPDKILQNLPYFIYMMKTQSCFFHFSFYATLFYP